MGKASSNKKVSRAASTGGGRTARGTTPWGWYSVIALTVVLGTTGIVFSRNQAQDKLNKHGGAHPRVGEHWHAALGVYLCDSYAPNVPDSQTDPDGIHTHGDGVIHNHPFTRNSSGVNAKMKVFDKAVGLTLSATQVKLPGSGKAFTDGSTKCGDKVGHLSFWANSKLVSGNPADYKLKDRDLLVVAFTAKGHEFPKSPPSASQLDNLSDLNTTPTPATAPPGATTDSSIPTTSAPAESTASTASTPSTATPPGPSTTTGP